MKILFYLGNKSHTAQIFTPILQNRCSKKTLEKCAKLFSAYEKLFLKICRRIP